ncbi:hypothetical protein Nepgr_016919 [Nepenthes gracilis]|uniref:RRM domain-containing protein n=1 Tax=Nepenthes gracilis TaxID=150966 RepID=A0AAD3SNH1_NEPGR|nr:hypothetical protein Nepgr_016919 [Nepenthes gracilis]
MFEAYASRPHRYPLSFHFLHISYRRPSDQAVGISPKRGHGSAESSLKDKSMPVASSPMEKLTPLDSQTAKCLEIPGSYLMQDQNANLGLPQDAVAAEIAAPRSLNLWNLVDHGSWTISNFDSKDMHNIMSSNYENGLFSSSLSELFTAKLKLSANNNLYGNSVDTLTSHFEEEPFESLEEIEAQTIGNLLPDDDDFFSGVVDGLEKVSQVGVGDNIEDLDLFSSAGGMDLGDDNSSRGQVDAEFSVGICSGQLGGSNVSVAGKHPYGEHPSRTLFVRNLNSNLEDSELRVIFEQYGDIRTMYTACKNRGFAMISYYDIRAARHAMEALQNKPLRQRKLDIHYSIPKDNASGEDVNDATVAILNLDSSVSNDDLHQIFGVYGEIKEICEGPCRSNHKFIEFYDVRAAEAAGHALNQRIMAGKRKKPDLSRPGGERSSIQPLTQELLQSETALFMQQSTPGSTTTMCFSGSSLCGPITSTSMESETCSGSHSGMKAPVDPFIENAFRHGISSSVPSSLSSYLAVESVGNQLGISEPHNSLGNIKCDFRGLPTFHPHSLPECHDGLANGAPCCSIGCGSYGNRSFRISGHHYMWNNTNHGQFPSLKWPNSPSFSGRACAVHPPSNLHGFPRVKSQMPNSLMNNHHVGSTPAANSSLCDKWNAYLGGSPDASGFHQGPLGNIRHPGSPLHHMDFVSHNVFPHVIGNCMDLPVPSRNVGVHFHHQRCMLYSSRAQKNPLISSVEPPNEHLRIHRSESSSTQPDIKKRYELDLDRILRGEDNRTTLMIKNIPNKYTSKMLMAAIDEVHRGTYDFVYLPIDFKNKCNIGYAFINMISPSYIIPLNETFNGKKWEKFNSEKVASLAYARIQGKQALIAHFQNSSLMNEDKRCRPILLDTDGPNAGDQVPFPMAFNARGRPGKPSSSSSEDNHLGITSSWDNKKESSDMDSSLGPGKESD